MLNKIKKESLSKTFLFLSIIIAISFLLLSSVLTISIVNNYKKEQEINLVKTAGKIERTLNYSFNYVSRLMMFFGEEIQRLDYQDTDKITKILRGELTSDNAIKELFSWTLFDWIDRDNILRVSTAIGKAKKEIDMSFRSYTRAAHLTPWKLHFSAPAVGIPSGQWIIPAGMGITDLNGKFIGTIALGFAIDKLSASIEKDIGQSNVTYIVLDKNANIVLTSEDYQIDKASSFFKENFKEINLIEVKKDY